jgi:nucleoside phosphorylase
MYQEINFITAKKFIEKAILIVIATNLETRILHKYIKPLNSDGEIFKCFHQNNTYYIGLFGKYCCFHVQCGTMGSVGFASSIVTIKDAINEIKPKITIMIGIAFGVDEKEQEIGDVLIAESIVPYDFKKITPDVTIIRTNPVPTSQLLLNRFKNLRDWQFPLEKRNSNMIITPIFSGEELINSKKRRQELEEFNPQAKGGEMEGVGLSTAANGKTEWILVKGVCDFADGNKDLNKGNNQILAMEAATSICLALFSSVNSFEHINLFPTSENLLETERIVINPKIVNNVLFNIYDIEKEKYYLKREKDDEILTHFDYYSIWVNGKSGRGKSISLIRNLYQSKINFITITLASCIGLSIQDFFYEIYIELMSVLKRKEIIVKQSNYQTTVREINKLLAEFYKGETIFLLIDEIPLGDDDNFKHFVQGICSLFISSALQNPEVNIRYVLSSIYSAEKHIPEYMNKVRDIVKFITYENWSTKELNELIMIIENELSIKISELKKELIINESKGSPRWIKSLLKNAIIIGGFDDANIDKAIESTNRQKIM